MSAAKTVMKKRPLTVFEMTGIAAVVLIGAWFLNERLVTRRLGPKRARLQNEIALLKGQIEAMKANPPNTSALYQSVKKAQDQWLEATRRLEKAREILAKPDEIYLVHKQMMDAAERYRLKIEIMADQPKEGVPALASGEGVELPPRTYHKVTLWGDFRSVRNFLESLGQMKKKVWVDSVVVSLRNENGELVVSMVLCI